MPKIKYVFLLMYAEINIVGLWLISGNRVIGNLTFDKVDCFRLL